MHMNASKQTVPSHPRPRGRRGFTLVELLVVIGIIGILIGILIPTVGRVRRAAYGAKTQQIISSLSTAIEAYYQDYHAYPGPIQTSSLYMQSGNIGGFPAADKIYPVGGPYTDAAALKQITQAQNLTLGLSGGLKVSAGGIVFDPADVGKGPRTLLTGGTNSNRLGKGAYAENLPMSSGQFSDQLGTPNDNSAIPVFLDGYPKPLPILYMRARTGAAGVIGDIDGLAVAATAAQQYDMKEIWGYTSSNIGEGKDSSKQGLYSTNGTATPANWPQHGLRTILLASGTPCATTPAGSSNYTYPYDTYPYLGNPSFTSGTGAAMTFSQPRQKDGYILISAGADRIYGTEDDVCSFGALNFAK